MTNRDDSLSDDQPLETDATASSESESGSGEAASSGEAAPDQEASSQDDSKALFDQPLPVLPIRNSVLYPEMMMPLVAGRPASLAAVEQALASEDKTIVVVPQIDPNVDQPGRDDLFEFGTVAVIKRAERHQDSISFIAQGLQRVRLGEVSQTEPFLALRVEPAPITNEANEEVEARTRAMIELATKIAEHMEGNAPAAIVQIIAQVKDPLNLAYLLASLLNLPVEKDLQLLAASSYIEALKLMHEYLAHELKIQELRAEIASSTQSEMSREQREYFLRRQLETIKAELGEESTEQADVAELRRRFDETKLPDHVRKDAERELRRLERMSPAASDYQVTRTYLELILELPWYQSTEDNLDLNHARQILDADHYGLEEIKDRILEHLAVMKLNPDAHAPILCFVGPPGVGKTSLGKSIARALGRKFERLALGGLHDESELRGHRRTYIGAMPGRVIQGIRRAESNNPLIMLDEIDKLGRDFRGDPAAALMEILDPEQNSEFRDNYLDQPFDLSKVFFITTANTLDTIPQPLLDRMEVIRLAGYSSDEKEHIARRYLIPRQIKNVGLTEDQLVIPEETLSIVIRRYTREAGVRELERTIGRIARKIAKQYVEGATLPATVTPENLPDILGPERFTPEKARQRIRPGVAAGLAWTPTGGDVLYVEAAELGEGDKLTLTGHLGQVMKESVQAARSCLYSIANDFGIDRQRLVRSNIHVHVPSGAVPKDGPSAGVTMATALASLFSKHEVRSDTAMTGEITLSGLVLPVGGIKEKVLAAHRLGMKRVILPKDNEKDLTELPQHVREELEFVLASRIEEVLAAAIPQLKGKPSETELAV